VVKKIRGQDGVKMESSCVKMESTWRQDVVNMKLKWDEEGVRMS